jgi:hypothetical protein
VTRFRNHAEEIDAARAAELGEVIDLDAARRARAAAAASEPGPARGWDFKCQ